MTFYSRTHVLILTYFKLLTYVRTLDLLSTVFLITYLLKVVQHFNLGVQGVRAEARRPRVSSVLW
jgi:hypothetical protein